MTAVLALFLLGAAVAVVAYPLFRARVGETAPRGAPDLDEARERREAALAALHDVEFDYRVGKLSDADYQTLRARLKAQAITALKDYDEQVRMVDDAIEDQVRALRLTPLTEAVGGEVCVNCGADAHHGDVFCARCGARLRESRVERAPRVATPRRASRISRGWLVGAGVFAALWIALAAFLYFNAAAQAREQNPIATLRATDFHSLAISPADPNRIFFGQHDGGMVSGDGGRTWAPLNVAGDAMALAIATASPQRVYLGGHDVLARSDDGGKTWRAVANNLPSQDIHALAALPSSADALYAFVVGRGLFLSADGGARWQRITNALPNAVSALAVLPGAPDVFFVGTQGGGVWRSDDGGATWQSANGIVGGALRGRNVNALAFDYTTGTLFVGTEEGVSFNQNRSAGWVRRNLNSDVAALALSADGQTIVVVNSRGQVFRSIDRGVTWSGK